MTSRMPPQFPPDWASGWGRDALSPFPYAYFQLGAGVAMRLRWIPPGSFMMGSPESERGRFDGEGPQHGVELRRGYWLGEAPCTQAEWEAVMGENPSHYKGEGARPVEQVSWEDCQQFCGKLRERHPGLEARLPSEAEWEYACRAGTESAYSDGSECTEPEGKDPALVKVGWFDKNSDGKTHAVRQLEANRWGVYDVHGNVLEWCEDWYGEYGTAPQWDPRGPAYGSSRVVRGGSWDDPARLCRSAYRFRWRPSERFHFLGFRLAAGPVSPGSEAGSEGSGSERGDEGRGGGARDGDRSGGDATG